MDFSALVKSQIDADRRRGFLVDFNDHLERIGQLERDLVGLLGEVGEFANVLKKIRLTMQHEKYRGQDLSEASPKLREELADAAIYIFRLSALLGADLEADILAKMKINRERYGSLEQ